MKAQQEYESLTERIEAQKEKKMNRFIAALAAVIQESDEEPAKDTSSEEIDLGITLAVVSSYKDQVIDEKTVVFGEVGLSGEVRAVSMAEQRVLEAKKLGFERVILPAVCMKSVEKIGGIALIPVENIQDAILRVGKN